MVMGVNSAFSVAMFYKNVYNTDIYINKFHFRIFTGTIDDTAVDVGHINDAFTIAYVTPIMAVMSVDLTVFKRTIQWITPALGLAYDFDSNDVGFGNVVGLAPPSNCCCVIERSFQTGRKSIGRKFFGPFGPGYDAQGNWQVGGGVLGVDATPLKNIVLQPLSVAATAGPAVCRPIVSPKSMAAADPQQDVRTTNFSPLVTFLHSRRPGRGM